METVQTVHEERLRPNNSFWPFSFIMILSAIDGILVGCGILWIRDTYLHDWWILGAFVAAAWVISGICAIVLIGGIIVHVIQCITLSKINRKGLKSINGHSIQQPISKQN